jgi:hypothetical protein
MISSLQAVRAARQPPRRVRVREDTAPTPEQPATPPLTNLALGLGLAEDGPGLDTSPASSRIISQIRYEPPEPAQVAAVVGIITPPPTTEALGLGFGSSGPASYRAGTRHHDNQAGRGSIHPSSSQVVRVPASSQASQ